METQRMNTFQLLLQGSFLTIKVTLSAAAFSFILGGILGIFSSDRLKIPVVSSLIEAVTFIFRAIPFFVQLLIVYFVLPDFLGFNLDPFPASVLALGICSSGYVAQIIRGGINAIPPAQWESAYTLGYTTRQTLLYVILPQTFRNVLPTLNNEVEALLKSTAIASSIGMLELTRMGMNIVSREMDPVPIYLTIALFYIAMSSVLNLFSKYLERKLRYVKN